MAAKVRELLDDIVWGAGKKAPPDVCEETIKVCKEHVCCIMLSPKKVLTELEVWAMQQSKKHFDTGTKIMHIRRQMHGETLASVTKLEIHHYNIANLYNEVARGVWAVLYFNY
jgi:hypothetical protein